MVIGRLCRILSKSKGEATRLDGLGANNLCTELPRPYATLKFEEDTIIPYLLRLKSPHLLISN